MPEREKREVRGVEEGEKGKEGEGRKETSVWISVEWRECNWMVCMRGYSKLHLNRGI